MKEQLEKIPPEMVELVLKGKDPEKVGIPKQVGDYIWQLNDAMILFKNHRTIIGCAQELQEKYPNLSISTCKQRIYDSINYFNRDSTVTKEAWNNYFADQMQKLADLNIEARNFKEARVCMEKCREYRIAASEGIIDPNLKKFRPQIVSADMELERMGVKKQGLLGAYRKALSIIESRDLPELERNRLIEEVENELNISDVEYAND